MEKKKPARAVALRHDRGTEDAPQVVATGAGEIAKRILDLAAEHDIPIQQDPDLVNVLAYLDVGDSIPVEVYRAVAEILVFIYQANKEFKPA